MFKVVDRDVVQSDWVRSEGSTGSVIVRVSVRWDKELGGFLFEEVLVDVRETCKLRGDC